MTSSDSFSCEYAAIKTLHIVHVGLLYNVKPDIELHEIVNVKLFFYNVLLQSTGCIISHNNLQ